MATRYLYPADRLAFVYSGPNAPILVPDRNPLTIFVDEGLTTLADIRELSGALIPYSCIFTDEAGLIPEFFGPLGVTRLWAKPTTGPAYPLDANYGLRIDELIFGPGGGGGAGILAGIGPPPITIGAEGSFYIDELAHDLYGPKGADGLWGLPYPLAGPPGPRGSTGPAGPGGVGQSYTHSQYVSSATWEIVHPLPFVPNVSVVDSSGAQVFGDLQVVDSSHLRLLFSVEFAGSAFLS